MDYVDFWPLNSSKHTTYSKHRDRDSNLRSSLAKCHWQSHTHIRRRRMHINKFPHTKMHTLSKPHAHAFLHFLCQLSDVSTATSVPEAASCCYYAHDSRAIKAAKCVFPDSSCRRNVLSREIAFPVRCEAAMALISHMCGHSGCECVCGGGWLLPANIKRICFFSS